MQDDAHPSGALEGPSWINPEIQQNVVWRDGDVVISVPPKSGTTWTMNIVHQLLTGGRSDFRDIYEEVPWLEFLSHPEQTHQAVLDRVDAMPTDRRRAFKTHSPPPGLPFIEAGSGKDVKYIVILRNPEEALVSIHPFLDKHTDEWFALWGMPKAAMYRPDFPSFYYEVVDNHGMQGAFFGFLAAWWQFRNEPNVLFLHFSDMKRDHDGSVRKIAEHIGTEPTKDQWHSILEYTSFPWMKTNEHLFEGSTLGGEVPVLARGAMIRKGETGNAKADGMTDEISQHLREVGRQIFPDLEAVEWLYSGGKLP
jgi:aryl sulfotransferase